MLQEYWASTVIFIGIFSQCSLDKSLPLPERLLQVLFVYEYVNKVCAFVCDDLFVFESFIVKTKFSSGNVKCYNIKKSLLLL